MKKVRYQKKENQKKKQNLILGGIIIFIMVSSALGYFGSQGTAQRFEYKGLRFELLDSGMLKARLQDREFQFNYLPQSLENMSFNSSALSPLLQTRLVYTTSASDSPMKAAIAEADYLLQRELFTLGLYVVEGFTDNTTSRPVISCLNASAFVPVILFEASENTEVSLEDSCIIVRASSRLDFLALKDRMLYTLLGILE
jgi:hypothetical protein